MKDQMYSSPKRNETVMPAFTSFTKLEILARTISTPHPKNIQIETKEVKLSLFTDDMITYVEKLTEPTKMFLQLIGEISKVAGYKINIQK